MSRCPNSFTIARIVARTLISSVTSHVRAAALAPRASSFTTVRSASAADWRYVMITSAPALARASALAWPSRRAPPVTSATFPRNEFMPADCKLFYSVTRLCLPTKDTSPMVRFGIVGFGLHGDRRLMPGFALAKQCKVTALQRRNLEKARASAAQYKIPFAFDSVADLCASPEVDAVLVTSPDALHLPDTLTALSHGKPVLCEKPMAMNAGEVRKMIAASRSANLLLGVAQIIRK